ncbi:MAG: MgtC/SapB family protein [Flavobacteriales bacterium]|nr:MgtC/SapB family protein [Flavobacteriales bacterium]
MDEVSITVFALKVSLAAVAGLVIGAEREYRGKSAGIKTNMLVSIGAAVFVITSFRFADVSNTDMTRVLSEVVVGVGFLGAGVILQKKDTEMVIGLTTAATIWCSAAVGCMAATGMYWHMAFVTFLILLINIIFGMIDYRISKHGNSRTKDG